MDLVKTYQARITETNNTFHAVTELDQNVLADAQDLQKELKSEGPRSSLDGVPLLLKDNIPTLDSTRTTCGSYALVGTRPSQEAAGTSVLWSTGAVLARQGEHGAMVWLPLDEWVFGLEREGWTGKRDFPPGDEGFRE